MMLMLQAGGEAEAEYNCGEFHLRGSCSESVRTAHSSLTSPKPKIFQLSQNFHFEIFSKMLTECVRCQVSQHCTDRRPALSDSEDMELDDYSLV